MTNAFKSRTFIAARIDSGVLDKHLRVWKVTTARNLSPDKFSAHDAWNVGAISRENALARANERSIVRSSQTTMGERRTGKGEQVDSRIGVPGSTSNDTVVVSALLRFCPERLPSLVAARFLTTLLFLSPLPPAALRAASFSSCRSQRERAQKRGRGNEEERKERRKER